MKKLLAVALVLVLCLSVVLVACDKPGGGGTTESNNPVAKLDAAADAVYKLNKDSIPSETTSSFDLSKAVPLEGIYSFPIEWTVNTDKIQIVDKGNGTQVTVKIPERSPEEIVYTLTATVKADDGSTKSVTFERKVPQFVVATYDEYIAACEAKDENKTYNIVGYVVGVNADKDSSSVGSLWIMDKDGHGYYAYAPVVTDAVKASRETINAEFPFGTEVIVNGTLTLYNGAYEFNKGCTVKKTGRTAEQDNVTLDYVDRTEAFGSIGQNYTDPSLVPFQATMASLTGITMGRIDGLNLYFTIGENDREFICYNNVYLMDDKTMEAFKEKWVPGGKANLKGIVNVYSSKYQIYPNSLDCLEIVQQTDAEKVEGVKNALSLEEKYSSNFTLPTSTLVNVTWTVSGTGATIGNDNLVTITQTNEDQQVVFTATITSGDVTDTKVFNVTISRLAITFIKKALDAADALADKATTPDSYMLIGTVKEITSAYSEEYKNVSFMLTDGVWDVLIYRYNLDDAATIKVGDFVSIAAPMKKFGTTLEAVATFVKMNVTDIATAYKAGNDGTGVDGTMVYGQIVKIGSEYSEQFNNITVTISDGTNKIDCYRLTGGKDLAVGDYILVTGKPDKYKTTVQFAQGATYTKSAIYVAPICVHVDENADGKCDLCEKQLKFETAEETVNAAYALAVGESLLTQTLTGTIKSIDTAYSADFKNITVTIQVGELADKTISCFRLAGGANLAVGDVITVTGTLLNKDGKVQFDAKSTYVLSDANILAKDAAALTIKDSYFADFELPLAGANGSTITWAPKEPTSVISIDPSNGKVTINPVDPSTAITLVATLSKGEAEQVTKEFPITILKETPQYTVNYSAGENGTIASVKAGETVVATGTKVDANTKLTVTVAPAEGFRLASVTVNGTADTSFAGKTSFELTITAETTFAVAFAEIPAGPVVVASLTFPDGNSGPISSYTDNWFATCNGIKFNISNFNNNKNVWSFIKCGREGKASVASIATDAAFTDAITKITIDFDKVSSVNSAKIIVASDAAFSKDLQEIDFTSALKAGKVDVSITTPTANCFYKIVFDCASASGNGPVVIKSVDYIA